jgi:hypothetical protein
MTLIVDDALFQMLFQPPHPHHSNARLLLELVNDLEMGIECLASLKKRFISICF